MTDFVDIKTLVICYGLCCCTQLVAFVLLYRVNRDGQGIRWWALGSVLLGLPFTAITFFALAEARHQWPQAGASFTGLLTALYGLGQIAGPPMVAALLARAPSQAQGFEWGLSLAASALLLGLLMFVWMVWRWPNGATK